MLSLSPEPTLRIVSWNVHKCTGGLDRRHDPARTAAVLAAAAPDVILLQEVAQNARWYGSCRQVDVLGDALGMPHRSYFVNVRFGPRRGEYGNAILSRSPILRTSNVDLTLPGKKPRSGLHAELRLEVGTGTRTLHVFALHLGLGERERRAQLQQLLAVEPLRGMHAATPCVVAGDFNDVWGTLGKLHLEPAGFRGPARSVRTFPAWAPVRALDSFYVRGDLELVHLAFPRSKGARTASDHLPLVADLRLGAAVS
ncbi:MAG: endonuclease/exonuclease/phosphatase family protein [Planctomycetes bacterium]|nr:endonuclease/exonuclease/phosphatase family protein [Planctomycetota bacterium]